MKILFNGNPVNLSEKQLEVGDAFPDFAVTANDMSTVTLNDTSGKRVFLAVPSVDTPVCDLEVRTFNQRLAGMEGVVVWTVSMDLPFAQQRWCSAVGIDAIQTVSDYKDRSFALATGTLIQELGLLARAVFVVDASGKITYCEYVPEVTEQPDFNAAVKAVEALV